ncbi:MAG: hypothetical protein LBJ60_09040 [Tannerellaceae bacterium]|jgi:hypothetical protein|nr:hypothetical protein [Tannerellaceae bacterium]
MENGELKKQKAEGRREKAESRKQNENKSNEKKGAAIILPMQETSDPFANSPFSLLPSAFLIFNFQLSIFNLIWARPPSLRSGGRAIRCKSSLAALVPGYPLQSLSLQ